MLHRASLALRAAGPGDLAFLRTLYATTRADELAGVPWPDDAKARFLDQQFALQHAHYVAQHPGGDFLIVTRLRVPVGRLYLDRTTATWLLIDIAVLPEARGGGIGAMLVRWLQRAARRGEAEGIELHVLHGNTRAARLYAALGFVAARSSFATHARMTWQSVS